MSASSGNAGPSSTQLVRDALLASLPGHSDEDAHVVTYLLAVLDDAGYVVVPRGAVQNALRVPVAGPTLTAAWRAFDLALGNEVAEDCESMPRKGSDQ